MLRQRSDKETYLVQLLISMKWYFLGNLTKLLACDDAAMFPDINLFFGENNVKASSRKEVQTVLLRKSKKIFKKK